MPLNTMRDLMIDQLNELLAAEKDGVQLLPKLALAASDPELAEAFRMHARETTEHLARLEGIFADIELVPEAMETRGMKGLWKDCMELAAMRHAEPHVRDAALIAVAQHVEHDEIVGYGCARTWATLLGNPGIAEILQKTLDEEKASDVRLSKMADAINKAAVQTAAA